MAWVCSRAMCAMSVDERSIVWAWPWRLASIFCRLAILGRTVDVYGRLVGWLDAYVFSRSEVAVVAVGKIGCTADF